jgi:adenylate cyclase
MSELGPAYRLLAATYGKLGRLEDAHRAASELLKIYPEFSIERYSSRAPYRDKALLAKYVEGLRLAGAARVIREPDNFSCRSTNVSEAHSTRRPR